MTITASFVKVADVYVGRAEANDGTTPVPLRCSVKLQEVYAVERHLLAVGTEVTITGDVTKTG